MRPTARIVINDDLGEKFFGEGPARLLRAVEREGSLLQAARSMQMAYSKATRLISHAETVLGFSLLARTTGGASGGGSILTDDARDWLERYERYRDACFAADQELYRRFFPEYSFGCVIMASGLGKRFGGNKLMADFQGEPLIQRILTSTDNLFAFRVAVTRSEETAAYLRAAGIETVFHDLPGRNDTVRLGLSKVIEMSRKSAGRSSADMSPTGCLFCQSDQPLLTRSTIKSLLQSAAAAPSFIWRPECQGAPGSPVWFPSDLFPELLMLPEGKGGGVLIKKYPERVKTLSIDDPKELRDVDTVEDLKELLS